MDKLIENARAETRQPLVQLRRSNSCAQMRAVFRSLPPATVQKEAANAVVIENGASRFAVTEADFDRLLLRGNSAGVMLVESALAEAAAVFGWNLENGVLPFKRVVVLGGGSSFPAVQQYFVQRFSIPMDGWMGRLRGMGGHAPAVGGGGQGPCGGRVSHSSLHSQGASGWGLDRIQD